MKKTKKVDHPNSTVNHAKSGADPDIIYSEDFADQIPADWTTASPGASDCQWQWTDVGPQGEFGIAPLQSTTAGNGWMMLDSDGCGQEGVMEDVTLTSPVIDLSDQPSVTLRFQQLFRAFNNDTCRVEFSSDGGDTWPTAIEINPDVAGNSSTPNPDNVNIFAANYIGGESQARVRFHWKGAYDYGWEIDDVMLVASPNNDLKLANAQYTDDKVVFDDPDATFQDYINSFEYTILPVGQVRNTNFTAQVINIGAEMQTNVVLNATVTFPDGSTGDYSSESVDLGVSDTARITMPDTYIYGDSPQTGDYTVDMEVTQDSTDNNPADNQADQISWTVSEDRFAHDPGTGPTFYPAGQNVIFGTPMGVMENSLIVDRVGFVVTDGNADYSSIPGTVVYANIRQDVVFVEEDADGAGEAETGSDLDGNDESELLLGADGIPVVVNEEDLTTDPNNPVWIWAELEEPITLSPGSVYQPEVRIPESEQPTTYISAGPASGVYSGAEFDFSQQSGGPQGWYFLGTNAPLIRLSTVFTSGLYEVDQIEGVELGQNFPNPAKDHTTIEYSTEQSMGLKIEVYDLTGRRVYSEDLGTVTNGEHRLRLNTKSWSTGRYDYSLVNDEGHRLTESMIVGK